MRLRLSEALIAQLRHRGGQGEQALSDAGEHAMRGAGPVVLQAELALEGVEHRLDPLSDAPEAAMPARFVAAVRAQQPHAEPGYLLFDVAPCQAQPLSASTVAPGTTSPVSTAMVSRSRQTSRSPSFGSAKHQVTGIPSGAVTR